MNAPPRGRVARSHRRRDRVLDNLFVYGTGAAVGFVVSLVAAIAYLLAEQAVPTIRIFGARFLFTTEWNAPASVFGAEQIILGTLITSAIALLIGVPISLGIAMFLSEEAPGWARTPLAALVELLAAVPSVIYGLWGVYVLTPVMQAQVDPALSSTLGPWPVIGPWFHEEPS
ncbi:MAG: phosphate ABC transporter permease PstC, partial [Thermoplasmata archaeon]|nr:phosphate ABC transporter permease PstC [Thermoplasmata archaeon]